MDKKTGYVKLKRPQHSSRPNKDQKLRYDPRVGTRCQFQLTKLRET